jgi:hypothetical protein
VLAHPIDAARGALLPAIHFVGAPHAVVRGTRCACASRRPADARSRCAGASPAGVVRAHAPPRRGGRRRPRPRSVTASMCSWRATGAHAPTRSTCASPTRLRGGRHRARGVSPYLGRPTETLLGGDVLRVPRGTELTVRATPRGRARRGAGRARGGDVAGGGRCVDVGRLPRRRAVVELAGARRRRTDPRCCPPRSTSWWCPTRCRRCAARAGRHDDRRLAPLRARVVAGDDHGLASVSLRAWVVRADGRRDATRETRSRAVRRHTRVRPR